MRKCLFYIGIILYVGISSLHAQEDLDLYNNWQYYSDAENSLYKYFCSVAFEQLNSRKTAIQELETKMDWQERQLLIRKKLLNSIGPFPSKTPLNAQITGVIQKEDYRVEKIIFESMPGYFVTAAIFIPENIKGKAPAILNAIGHSAKSFKRDIYQRFIINLVKKGFIVLAYDQIGQGERLQYYDKKLEKSRFTSTSEHTYPGAQCFISGYSPAKYFIWDGIRAIDYLLTRKEVDPLRIGMTGLSGGGTSTAVISAIDDRIVAAAPSCYITNYEYLLKTVGPQDAEQNLYHFLAEGMDHADFIELRAPKPTLIVSTTRDFFSIQGARKTFAEAKKAFIAFDKEDNLQMTESDYIHGFTKKNNEATFAFFQKYLDNPGYSTDEDVEVIPEIELQVTETGQLSTSRKGETIFSLNRKLVEKQMSQLEITRSNIDEHLLKIEDAARNISGFETPKAYGKVIFSGRFVNKEYSLEKYLISGSGEYLLPLALLIPKKNKKRKTVLLLHEKGKGYAVNKTGMAKELVKDGYTVLVGDLPGIGELGGGYLKGNAFIDDVTFNLWFTGILTGRSIVGLRAEDIIRMVHFLKTKISDSDSISAISVGALGSELLHAATFEKDIQKICMINSFLTFSEIALEKEYNPTIIHSTVAGAIEKYDLSDLMALIYPRKLIIINPIACDGSLSNEVKTNKLIQFPKKIYQSKDKIQNFNLIYLADEKMILDQLLFWLR